MIQWPPRQVVQLAFFELVRFLRILGQIPVGRSLQPTSWWRSVAHNREVGGDPKSQHLLGLALDVAGDPAELLDFATRARAAGLIAVRYSGHVHVQARVAGTFDDLIA